MAYCLFYRKLEVDHCCGMRKLANDSNDWTYLNSLRYLIELGCRLCKDVQYSEVFESKRLKIESVQLVSCYVHKKHIFVQFIHLNLSKMAWLLPKSSCSSPSTKEFPMEPSKPLYQEIIIPFCQFILGKIAWSMNRLESLVELKVGLLLWWMAS